MPVMSAVSQFGEEFFNIITPFKLSVINITYIYYQSIFVDFKSLFNQVSNVIFLKQIFRVI
jgi:hypothetical protein